MKIHYGIVEDRQDPLKIGRVRVRIHGIHSPDKQYISTPDLPWAQVMLPTTSAGLSGFGTQHGLVEGSTVVVFFRDEELCQQPVVIGSTAGIHASGFREAIDDVLITRDPERGFNDPRKLTTAGYEGKPDGANPDHSPTRGFGLTTAESVMSGTPIIVNVTGGLQDQCGFKKKSDGKYFTADDYIKIGSLHKWRDWEDKVTWGEWATPIWSRAQSLTGSVPTPYIWDDKIDVTELSEKMEKVYNTPKEELNKNGLEGRRAFIEDMGLSQNNMCQQLINGVESTFKNFKPRKRYELFKIV